MIVTWRATINLAHIFSEHIPSKDEIYRYELGAGRKGLKTFTKTDAFQNLGNYLVKG